MKIFDIQRLHLTLNVCRVWPGSGFWWLTSVLACLSLVAESAHSQAQDYPAVDCVIQPYQIVDLGSPVSGVIEKIHVERSDFVGIGEAVAQMEDRVERATVELARARTEIDAQLQAEEINVRYDGKTKNRIDSLYNRKVIPVDNKDNADREAELSGYRLQQVKDLQRVRNLELARARELVEQKVIRSTIDGFVINRFKSEGEFVEDQPILRIAQLNPLNIEAIIPMKYFGVIQPGMRAEVMPEMAGLNLREAQVTVVDRIGDAASGTFGVRLEMNNPGFEIPAGLKCDVKFLETPASVLAEAQRAREKNLPGNERAKEKISNSRQADNPVRELQVQQKMVAEVAVSAEATIEAPGAASSIVDAPQLDTANLPANKSSNYKVGPFLSQQAFFEARSLLQGLDIMVRTESIEQTVNYIVLTTSEGSLAEEQLIDARIKDFGYMYRPPYRGRYSLGVYDSRERADARVNLAQDRGVSAEVVARTREKTVWWLDLVLSSEDIDAHAEVLRKYGLPIEMVQLLDQSR